MSRLASPLATGEIRCRRAHAHRSAAHGVLVPEAAQRLVEWEEDVMRALVLGLHQRTPGDSHLLFTLVVAARDELGELRESRLQLVDLGSPAG